MAAVPQTEPAGATADAEEARLARAAAAGDGSAFATLYERYEGRAFNLALRITGSRDDAADATQDAFLNVLRRLPGLGDRELVFGSYLLTATRNACYDLMQKRKRAEPSDSIPEGAAPVGASAGGAPDPGDPGDDPDRNVLLDAQQEEIREANSRLPERQREALALFELEDMTYDEIADVMEMNRNSVAQLISRARIKLRDELRGTALASVAPSSPDCERALPLIAMEDDGQLEAGSPDADWLAAHMDGCHTCHLSREAMQEAGSSYRCWAPVAAVPWLMRDTIAKAAELTGSDWSDVIAEREAARNGAAGGGRLAGLARHGRRNALLAAAVAGVFVLVGFERPTDDAPIREAAVPASEQVAEPEPRPAPEPERKPRKRGEREVPAPAADLDAPVSSADTTPLAPATLPGGPVSAPRRRSAPPRRGARGAPQRNDSGGGTPGLVGPRPAPNPPPAPPPVAPAPVDPPVVDPPPPPTCRDAFGRPIPCPPR